MKRLFESYNKFLSPFPFSFSSFVSCSKIHLFKFSSFSLVEPKSVSPQISHSSFPSSILLPDYAVSGIPSPQRREPVIHSRKSLKKMRHSCRLAEALLSQTIQNVRVGTTTNDIDVFFTSLCLHHRVYPSPLNYHGFPKSLCTSVNNVSCHGIPDSRPLQNGDIINLDVSLFVDGVHGDTSKTFVVGKSIDDKTKSLLNVAKDSLYKGISICGPGVPFSSIGSTIQSFVERKGFKVMPLFMGHGISDHFHGAPDIIHVENSYKGQMLPGMTFTIEPVISEGSSEIEILSDNWTAVSVDGSRSAQFEHTILITESGFEILTA